MTWIMVLLIFAGELGLMYLWRRIGQREGYSKGFQDGECRGRLKESCFWTGIEEEVQRERERMGTIYLIPLTNVRESSTLKP